MIEGIDGRIATACKLVDGMTVILGRHSDLDYKQEKKSYLFLRAFSIKDESTSDSWKSFRCFDNDSTRWFQVTRLSNKVVREEHQQQLDAEAANGADVLEG